MIVLDANVAAKWYLNEPGSDEAAQFLTASTPLLAPALIRTEVTGAVVKNYRKGLLPLDKARAACELWQADLKAGALTLFPDEELLAEAIEVALQIRHTLQDCLYLTVAARFDAPLITADRPFFLSASASGRFKVSMLPGCVTN